MASSGSWEYIVVGSGPGGGPVAANLARAGHRVLLLEAGGDFQSLTYEVPAFHPAASEEEYQSWQFFVRHYADEVQQARDSKYTPARRGVFYPRSGTLGGCTAHNAMILDYPSNSDWESIVELTGDESWSPRRMRRYFQRLERCRYRTIQRILQAILHWNPSRHGFSGWLPTAEADPFLIGSDRQLKRIVIDSALKELYGSGARATLLRFFNRIVAGLPTSMDPNDWRLVRRNAEGLRFTPMTVDRGRRAGTRELLLETRRRFPENLEIRLGALATRVLLDGGRRAVGVEYLQGDHLYSADPLYDPAQAGTVHQALASREVILAGGAFNSPQLLQLSGIGPPELLAEHGIPVQVPLPGVGMNLQDRYEAGVVLRMKDPFRLLAGATLRAPQPGEELDPQFRDWQQGKGVYTTNGVVLSIIKRSLPALTVPDLWIFGLVTNFRGYYPGYSQAVEKAHDYFTWAILKAHTKNSAGRVAIRSRDPRLMPDVDFHYFKEGNDKQGEDLAAVVRGIEFVRAVARNYSDCIESEEVPGKQYDTPEKLRQWVQDEAWGHHASCTCQIGPRSDPRSVVDSNFRVYGTQGLRVVDASVFPRIPGMFVVSAIYMIAEKASAVILADAANTANTANAAKGAYGAHAASRAGGQG